MKQVSEGIYRSARPTYDELKESGVKTVINLEDDKDAVEQERKWCYELGIIFISIPMSEIKKPDMNELWTITVLGIKRVIKPILIHCKHGHERTGIVIAEYRMKVEGWSKWKAIREALKEGFSPFYLWWFL
jgi:protein tyrosine/serine phosphatase